jgi:hypothetical protein
MKHVPLLINVRLQKNTYFSSLLENEVFEVEYPLLRVRIEEVDDVVGAQAVRHR